MTNRSISIGLFFIAMTTLLLELNLIKIYDTLWSSNLSYMVISMAMFALGVAGIFSTLYPIRAEAMGGWALSALSALFAVSMIGIFWVLNHFQFSLDLLRSTPMIGIRNIFISMLYITAPFFLSGLILTTLFSSYASHIQRLYFYDLVGASIGCLLVIPLIPKVAPEGLIIIAAGLALLAGAFFKRSKLSTLVGLIGAIVIAYPLIHDDYLSISLHDNKRNILGFRDQVELTYWDPIARIDIIGFQNNREQNADFKWIAYDGGTQTSYFYRFDGNFIQIRQDVDNGNSAKHFWGNFVLASHYLKRDTDQEVLVIGSAGGQEIKAALAYGAKHVDGIELVGKVVDLGKNEYAEYTGNVSNSPKVNVRKGEGRSFLRATDKKYDIIQIMSNHTSSSIASGSTAVDPTYLQTKEAYIEYFSHLKEDGILHINHHVYPRMLATAATAWRALGRSDFSKHVAVFIVKGTRDNLPTFMIKMVPWSSKELDEASILLNPAKLVVDPRNNNLSALKKRMMEGELTPEDLTNSPFQIRPTTDDRPYFNLLRKSREPIRTQHKKMLDSATAKLLNSQIIAGLPMDIVHLYVVGAGSSIFALLVILVPILFSRAGRSYWPNKTLTLAYFALLGLGFILFELVSIHLYMRLIGSPLYSLTTVIFGYLIGAGIGSFSSEKMGISPWHKWWLPFTGILVASITVLLTHRAVIDLFLQSSQPTRILVTLAMILPVAFFLGMAFPLGVLRLSETPYAKQAIAWAWGINGVFTVIGGFLSALLSIFFGFTVTLCIAISCYVLALLVFRKITNAAAY